MNTGKNYFDSTDVIGVIDTLEGHFDSLCRREQKINNRVFRYSKWNKETDVNLKGIPSQTNGNKEGLLRVVMVGSAELTLQGEVFYALRKNEVKFGNKVFLEMNVSEWGLARRNIDCVISKTAPDGLAESTFIELGHYATVQAKDRTASTRVYNKIRRDYINSVGILAAGLGPIIHVMFLTHLEKPNPAQSTGGSLGVASRDWPNLPKYFLDTVSKANTLAISTYRGGWNTVPQAIHAHLINQCGKAYIGYVKGCDEDIKLTQDASLNLKGRVDRYYCCLNDLAELTSEFKLATKDFTDVELAHLKGLLTKDGIDKLDKQFPGVSKRINNAPSPKGG